MRLWLHFSKWDSPRVNINSTDYSINITNAEPIFRQLAKAIQSGISEEKLRMDLLGKTQEMESAVKETPRFLKLYSDFIALAANHMTVVSPFIPALTHLSAHSGAQSGGHAHRAHGSRTIWHAELHQAIPVRLTAAVKGSVLKGSVLGL